MRSRAGTLVTTRQPGRPADEGGRKNVLIQVRLTQAQRDEAEEIANAIGVSLSDFVRMAMIEKAERYRREHE